MTTINTNMYELTIMPILRDTAFNIAPPHLPEVYDNPICYRESEASSQTLTPLITAMLI